MGNPATVLIGSVEHWNMTCVLVQRGLTFGLESESKRNDTFNKDAFNVACKYFLFKHESPQALPDFLDSTSSTFWGSASSLSY